jgi:hypothetical protein
MSRAVEKTFGVFGAIVVVMKRYCTTAATWMWRCGASGAMWLGVAEEVACACPIGIGARVRR